QKLDRQYILRIKKEPFGYSCLTNQKQYYLDNYPSIVVEKGNIDDVIMLMIKGEK
ncbi:MAG: ABC transporter ATP-binding protein, partial [Coprobacillus cateniformis]